MEITYIHLKSVHSTNRWAKENSTHLDRNKLTRITAEKQTGGYGRFNRPWVSPKGLNIYVTYFFTNKKTQSDLNHLSQLLCLSTAKLLFYQNLCPQIKWPNDILIRGKKIAGILCEIIDLLDVHGVILGAGININMPKKDLNHINQPATSILNEKGKKTSLEPLLALLDQIFVYDLALYQTQGFKPFYTIYNSLLTKVSTSELLKGER